MSIFEFDAEKEWKLIRQDEREIGIEIGMERGVQKGIQKGICAFIEDNVEENIPEERIIEKLMNRFGLIRTDAVEWVQKIKG